MLYKHFKKTWKVVVEKIPAIADEYIGINPIEAAQQQVVRVHQIITDCWKIAYQLHKDHMSNTGFL